MRYKEYNRNRVLEKCLKLFWNQGFGATSINRIVEATGVNRFSLYAEFQNKERILYAAVELYLERSAAQNLAVLSERAADTRSLTAFFEAFMQKEGGHPPGCFLIHISTELGNRHARLNGILSSYLDSLNQAFGQWAVRRGLKREKVIAGQLVGLYCSAMCYGIILPKRALADYLEKNLKVILKGGR